MPLALVMMSAYLALGVQPSPSKSISAIADLLQPGLDLVGEHRLVVESSAQFGVAHGALSLVGEALSALDDHGGRVGDAKLPGDLRALVAVDQVAELVHDDRWPVAPAMLDQVCADTVMLLAAHVGVWLRLPLPLVSHVGVVPFPSPGSVTSCSILWASPELQDSDARRLHVHLINVRIVQRVNVRPVAVLTRRQATPGHP